MSHSFYVSNIPSLPFASLLEATGIDNIKALDGLEINAGTWPAGTHYFYINGVSTRPVEVTFEDGTFQSRIFTAATPQDHMLAVKLAEQAARHSGQPITPEDNDAMDADRLLELYGEQWAQDNALTYLRMMVGMYQRDQNTMRLAGPLRELELGPRVMQQLLADPQQFSRNFFERFRLLNYLEQEDIFIANGIRLQEKEGNREVVLSVYSEDVPTVLSTQVDVICLRSENGDMVQLPTNTMIEVLGDQALWLSESIFLAPQLSGDEWKTLFEQARAHHINDMFDQGSEAQSEDEAGTANDGTAAAAGGLKARLNAEQWQLMLKAPYLIFVLVSAADGAIDKKEMTAFQKQLAALAQSDHPLLQQIVLESLPQAKTFLGNILGGDEKPSDMLKGIRELTETHMGTAQATTFKLQLCQLAKAIAEASGGGFLGFGKKISKEERQAITAIAALLGLLDA